MSKLTSDIQANLELFVAETKENQLVWGLRNEEGWLSCALSLPSLLSSLSLPSFLAFILCYLWLPSLRHHPPLRPPPSCHSDPSPSLNLSHFPFLSFLVLFSPFPSATQLTSTTKQCEGRALCTFSRYFHIPLNVFSSFCEARITGSLIFKADFRVLSVRLHKLWHTHTHTHTHTHSLFYRYR